MEQTYEEITNEQGQKVIKKTLPDGATIWIPLDPSNSDYAAYLKSLES